MTAPLTASQNQAVDEKDVSYFQFDPTGQKPPKRITKRQFDRDKNYVAFHPPQPERRP